MRGKPLLSRLLNSVCRITPADAGKTRLYSRLFFVLKDHPRGCGENKEPAHNEQQKAGSPPRMRGKLECGYYDTHTPGITPADAGKTMKYSCLARLSRDHPRGCGENLYMLGKLSPNGGSPPRMRGKPRSRGIQSNADGITPADAGKTIQSLSENVTPWDHPRGCGENAVMCRIWRCAKGSPPRMRGKLYCFACGVGGDGITPADAGKTSSPPHGGGLHPDHPRGCGEN